MSTSNNNTTIKYSVDASGAEAGINRLKSANAQASASMDAMRERQRLVTAAMQEAASNGLPLTAREANKLAVQYQKLAETTGKTRVEILNQQAAAKGVASTFSSMSSQIQAASAHVHEFNLNTTASRRELIVLAHEASQGSWSRFGGSFMVLSEQLDLMRYAMSPLGVAIGVTGAIAYTFFKTLHDGYAQVEAFNKSISATGGYVGLSAAQMAAMSNGLQTSHDRLSDVREAMAQVASTGAFTADNLALATQAALAMSSDIGVGTDKAAESLGKIQEDVLKWLAEYQRSHHTFSAAQVQEIDNFVKLGDTAGATDAIMRGIVGAHAAIQADADKHMGAVIDWWNQLKYSITRVKEAIASIGVPDSIDKQVGDQYAKVEAAERNLAQQRSMGMMGNLASAQSLLDKEKVRLDVLRQQQTVTNTAQRAKEAAAKSGDAKVAVDAYLRSDKYANPKQKQGNALELENKAFAKATEGLNKNSKDYQDALKRHYDNVAEINEQYAKKTKAHGNANNAINSALADQKNQMASVESARRGGIAQAKHDFDTGQLQYQDYYAKVRDINVKAYDDEIVIQKKRVALASGKTELAARQTALGELQKLQAERLKAETDYTRAIAEQQRKRQEQVDKYRTQQNAVLTRNASTYQAEDDTRFMTSDQAAQYNAELRLRQNFYQEVAKLREEFDSGKADQAMFDEKAQVATDSYNAQLAQLRDHLQKEAAIRNDFNAQIGLQIVQLSGNGKTTAQSLAEGFSSVWSTARSGLENFVTTGKFSFSSFTSSILADIAKIALKMAEMSIFKSLGTSMGLSLPGFATGGHISGAGTGTSDSIPAMLSNGEFVVNASATRQNRSLLEAINSGHASHFATGGAVGSSSGGGGSSVTNLTLTLSGNGGGLTQEDLLAMAPAIQNLIDKRMAQNMRGQGGYAYQQKYNQI